MKNLYRILAVTAAGFVLLFSLLATGAAATTVPPEPKPATQDSVVADPGVIEQFGPPGVILTTLLTGILMISRSVNEGKKIDVTTYKERAADAETRSNEEIGKVHKKLSELEKKLDDVIADRDEYRDTLEDRKAEFTRQILAMEKRHQQELEDQHAALMIEVHVRHRLERLLAQHGIQVPETPPPYTRSMRNAVTPQDEQQANESAETMRNLRSEDNEAID